MNMRNRGAVTTLTRGAKSSVRFARYALRGWRYTPFNFNGVGPRVRGFTERRSLFMMHVTVELIMRGIHGTQMGAISSRIVSKNLGHVIRGSRGRR